MKVEAECASCLLARATAETYYATTNPALRFRAIKEVMKLLNREFRPSTVPADIGTKRDRLIKELTDENFEKEISQGIFLVDFHATWCGPCRMLSPIIEKIAKHFEKNIKVGKIDIDSEQKTAVKYQVTSVPTLILFENGKEKNRLIGLRNFDEIKELISSLL